VRVMVTAGPEEDVLAKFARSDFQAKTGISAVVETVSRDLLAVSCGARIYRQSSGI
jgi:hypothetical protein